MDEPVTLMTKPDVTQPDMTQPDVTQPDPTDAGLGPSGPVSGTPGVADEAAVATPPAGQMRAGIEEAIDAIRPALQMDGGDVTLIGVDEASGVVEIELIGACVGCPASTMTLKAGIERILKDRVEGITEVNALGLEPALDY